MEVNNFRSSLFVLFVLFFHQDEPPFLSRQNKHELPLSRGTFRATVALFTVALCHDCSAAGSIFSELILCN